MLVEHIHFNRLCGISVKLYNLYTCIVKLACNLYMTSEIKFSSNTCNLGTIPFILSLKNVYALSAMLCTYIYIDGCQAMW